MVQIVNFLRYGRVWWGRVYSYTHTYDEVCEDEKGHEHLDTVVVVERLRFWLLSTVHHAFVTIIYVWDFRRFITVRFRGGGAGDGVHA